MDVRKRIAVLVAETEWAMVDQKRAVLEEALDGGDAIRQALIEPVEYKEDEKSNRVRECSARDVLASLVRRTRGINNCRIYRCTWRCLILPEVEGRARGGARVPVILPLFGQASAPLCIPRRQRYQK